MGMALWAIKIKIVKRQDISNEGGLKFLIMSFNFADFEIFSEYTN